MFSWPPSLLVLSTVPISDSSNNAAATVPVKPPQNCGPSCLVKRNHAQYFIVDISMSNESQSVGEVFALACNLTLESVNVSVNPRTFGLQEFDELSSKNKSRSELRQFPTAARSLMSNSTKDMLVQSVRSLPNQRLLDSVN